MLAFRGEQAVHALRDVEADAWDIEKGRLAHNRKVYVLFPNREPMSMYAEKLKPDRSGPVSGSSSSSRGPDRSPQGSGQQKRKEASTGNRSEPDSRGYWDYENGVGLRNGKQLMSVDGQPFVTFYFCALSITSSGEGVYVNVA